MTIPQLKYGDWIRYEGKDYQYFETTDYGEIVLRDPDYDWEFIEISHITLEVGHAEWVCSADDVRFSLGNNI